MIVNMQILRSQSWKKVFGCTEGKLSLGDGPDDFDLYPVSDHRICDKKNILAASWTPQELTFDQSDDENEGLFSILGLRNSSELSAVEKLQWLRSQLIGDKLEFVTPFGKRQLLYMDQTASGRGLLFIENYIVKNVLPIYGNTHTEDSFVGKRISSIVQTSARYIKKQLGGTSNDALLFCGSGSTAALKRLQEVMGIAIPSILRSRVIATLTHEERWVVFTGPYEHHSNLLSWRQSLAEVVEIPADSDGLIDVAALESALKSPLYRRRLILGSFSACSNVTGLMTDTRAISRLLHEHGAFACFDFAASAPHVHIDMRSSEKDGYDAIVLSPHKLTGGPGTPGILLMTNVLYMLGKNPPSTCGGGTVAYVNGFNEQDTMYFDNIEEREDAGTPPIVQKIRCALAFAVKEYMGHELIEQREAMFIEKAIKQLTANPNIRILGNTTVKRAAILSFIVMTTENGKETPSRRASTEIGSGVDVSGGKPLHGRFVVKLLNDLFGIQSRGGCACAGPYGHELLGIGRRLSLELRVAIQKGYAGLKPGWARVSFCYEMTDEEVDYVLAAIEVVAKYGQRFLALYALDWRTGDWTFIQRTTESPPSPLSDGNSHLDIHVALPDTPTHDLTTAAARPKFRHCLSSAKAIAHLLPKFPPPRSLPRDISDHLLLFRV